MDKKWLIVAPVATALAGAAPAYATDPVTDSNGKAHALILVPLRIVNVSDLEFGTVVSTSTSGTVTIPSDGSARIVSGGVIGLPSDPGIRAEVATAGAPGQQVLVTYSAPTQLTNLNGDTILVLAMVMEGSPIKTIDPVTNSLFIYFGGTLLIGADQPEGNYEGTFTVTIQYN